VFCDARGQADAVVELLGAADIAPAVFEFEQDDQRLEAKAALGKQAGTYALPSVWIGGKFVGGLPDVEKLNAFGNLVPKIAAAVTAHEDAIEEEDRKIADDLISKLVASQTVALFSKSFCRFSSAAKDELLASGIAPAVFELDKHPKGHAVMEELVRQTGRLTVPSVWVDGKHVGGSEEVKTLVASGELAKLAQAATPAS
jgi:glutaredoxin 3